MANRKKTLIDPMAESLTPEQEAILDAYQEEWTAIGRCCEPADRPEAESAIRAMYAVAGLSAPEIEWELNPSRALTNRAITEARKPVSMADFTYGQHDVYLLVRLACFREVFGLVEETEDIVPMMRLAKSCGWALCLDGLAVLCERHSRLCIDSMDRLHATRSLAIEYPDGWGVAAVRDIVVPNDWVLHHEKLDPRIALTEPNLDRRSAAALIIGWERVLALLAPKVIDSEMQVTGQYGYCMGELLQLDMPDEGMAKFLRVKWGDDQQAVLRVPPNMRTAREANAWTQHWDEKQDGPFNPQFRT